MVTKGKQVLSEVEASLKAAGLNKHSQREVGSGGRPRSFTELTERLTLSLPKDLAQALRLRAIILKRTPSQLIAELLQKHL